MLEKEKTISVNQLNRILSNYFKTEVTETTEISFADSNRQFNPQKARIGVGGVLNIKFKYISLRRL